MKQVQDSRFRHLDTAVGAFVAVSLAALVAAIVYIGIAHDLFTKKYEIRFTVDRGTGFAQGMPVKLSGFRIGRVKDLSLTGQAKVEVRLQIDRRYQKWIRTDSVATLVKEGLVGDSIIDVSVGSAGKELKDNDLIAFKRERELAELAAEFSDSVKSVLGEVRQTIVYVNDPNGDIKQSLGNLRRFTANLETTRREADTLLATTTDNVKAIGASAVSLLNNTSGRVDNIASGAVAALDNLTNALAGIEKRLPPLLDRAEGTLGNAEKLSLEIRKAAEKAAPRIPPLVEGAEELVGDADTVVKSLKDTWPFKNHIPAATGRGIAPGDSHD